MVVDLETIIKMKVKEAKQYLEECLDSLNRIKGTNLKVIDQETLKTKPSAKMCDSVIFTLSLDSDIFFKVHTTLWINIDEYNKLDYQKALMENIWDQVKEEVLKHNGQAILNGLQIPKVTLNGLGTYGPTATPRKEPLSINPDVVIYNKADIDTTLDLESYRLQQAIKQSRDDILAELKLKEHPRLRDEEDWYGKFDI